MKPAALLRELLAVAESVGVQVRLDKGRFQGGMCKVEGRELLVLNQGHPPEVNAMLLAERLARLPLDAVYLKPTVRAAIDAQRPKQAA